ncbi:MAG: mevalonate kinase family protein [Gammaproteobacteria bacterium]
MRVKASAPASLMLMGEYAVLHGHLALVCAVDKRMTVIMSFREDTTINIESTALGTYTTTIADLNVVKPFQFVLTVLKRYQAQLKQGLDIFITANFSTTIGFGSSSAVTVATLKALTTLLNISLSPLDLLVEGRAVVQAVQGRGSGADVAAAVYGGVVGYRMLSCENQNLHCHPERP